MKIHHELMIDISISGNNVIFISEKHVRHIISTNLKMIFRQRDCEKHQQWDDEPEKSDKKTKCTYKALSVPESRARPGRRDCGAMPISSLHNKAGEQSSINGISIRSLILVRDFKSLPVGDSGIEGIICLFSAGNAAS
jgi:hypothetical protein